MYETLQNSTNVVMSCINIRYDHRWASLIQKVAERAINAKNTFKSASVFKNFIAVAALNKFFLTLKRLELLKR